MGAEIVDLHEYFTVCAECGGFLWYIQWNTQQTDVMQLVCGDPECGAVIENPSFDNRDGCIYFEPDFDLD